MLYSLIIYLSAELTYWFLVQSEGRTIGTRFTLILIPHIHFRVIIDNHVWIIYNDDMNWGFPQGMDNGQESKGQTTY